VKVFINNHQVIIFKGARIGDAVLALSKEAYRALQEGKLQVIDCFGNTTEPDGMASENQEFFLVETPERENHEFF
jgi:hypothetical protein